MTARVASFPPDRFGKAFCLAPGLDGLALLLRSAPTPGSLDDLPDPWVRLADSGGLASTVVGRVAGGGDGGRLVGVVLRADGDIVGETVAAGDLWFKELTRELQTLAPEPTRLPPLWFCKRRSLVFVPPCPACGEPLAECVDDSVLAAAELGPRDATPYRHLTCPECTGPEITPRFYSLTGEPSGHPQVGDRWALVDGFGQQVEASRDAGNPHFPCQGCTFSHGCYPPGDDTGPGDARTLLAPLSFYGGGAWPVEFLPLAYDAASDLLGGRPATELPPLWGSPTGEETAPAAGFLFPAEREQRLPLEALLLKLTVFEQLCAGVEAVHRSLGRPHLNLNPETSRVELGGGGGAAPELWRSRVQPVGLDGARPVGDAARTFLPPVRFDLAYSHPGVAVCPGRGEWQPARFVVRVVEDDPAGGCVVEGVLETERIRPGEAGPADTFQVGLGQGLGFRSEILLPCTCRGSSGGGVALRSAPVQLDTADRERLAALKALPQVEARFTVSRRYGAECDLFSLGMLLFRSLLVNRSQAVDEVSQRCRFLAGELERRAGSGGAGTAGKSISGELERCLDDPLFDAGNLLWEPLPPGGTTVPTELWREVLELGVRLLTGIAGFSFLAAGAATTQVDGEPLGRVRGDLRRLMDKLRQTLFTWQPEPADEIRTVLAGLIDDPTWLDRVLSGAAESQPQSVPDPVVAAPAAAAAGPALQPVSPPPGSGPGLDETLILKPGEVAAALSSAQGHAVPVVPSGAPRNEPPDPSLDETMILQRPAGGGVPVAAARFEETMISRPGPLGASTARQPENSAPPVDQEPAAEDLDKTIILPRGKLPGGG